MARRLEALERQVEHALAGARARPEPEGTLLGTAVDEILAVYSDLRRWVTGEAPADPNPLGEIGRRLLYRLWWRVETTGVERLPATGRVLAIVNRAGTLVPYAGFMVAEALGSSDRPARPLLERTLLDLPVLGSVLAACGARPATMRSLRAVLGADQVAVTLPEGPGTLGKPWTLHYRLGPFVRHAMLRAAIETGTPIVPVAAIGSEEVQPTLLSVPMPGRLLGLPTLPLTPALLPLPTKWTLWIGEPLEVAGRWGPEASHDAAVLRTLRTQLRERLQALVGDGVRRRRSLFR